MYPHFLNKQTVTKPVFASEAEKENNLLPQNTTKLAQIIEEAVFSEKSAKAFFEVLKEELNDEDKSIAESIILDETKHHKLLCYVYTLLTENKAAFSEKEPPSAGGTLLENLSFAILEKAENARLYRELATSTAIAEAKELFYEIMSDEMLHMSLLNHLFAKYSQN